MQQTPSKFHIDALNESEVVQQPAEERYRDFCEVYKHFEQDVSLGHIASYLGITRESLSRIRRGNINL